MDNSLFIYHHLGLGDHIICNGLVRYMAYNNPQFDSYYVVVNSGNLSTVQFMYRDNKKIKFIEGNDKQAAAYLSKKPQQAVKYVNLNGFNFSCSWDEWFYIQHNISFTNRWNLFFVLRDEERENKLFNKLNPENKPFSLIHSAGGDGVDRINNNYINQSLEKIYVKKHTDNIFDYLMLVEKATEIHCVDSSFFHLVESVTSAGRLYYHDAINRRSPLPPPKYKKPWLLV